MSERQKVSRRSVLTAKFPYGKVSPQRNVLTPKYPHGEMFLPRSVRTAKHPGGKISYGEISFGRKFYCEKSGHVNKRDPWVKVTLTHGAPVTVTLINAADIK